MVAEGKHHVSEGGRETLSMTLRDLLYMKKNFFLGIMSKLYLSCLARVWMNVVWYEGDPLKDRKVMPQRVSVQTGLIRIGWQAPPINFTVDPAEIEGGVWDRDDYLWGA